MGIKHLSQANIDRDLIKKALITFGIWTLLGIYFLFAFKTQKFDYIHNGQIHSVLVEKGKDPVLEANSDILSGLSYSDKYIPITISDLTKDESHNGFEIYYFLKWEALFLALGVLWILLRYLNRLFYGEDGDTKDDW
jgi:hypothetical protein